MRQNNYDFIGMGYNWQQEQSCPDIVSAGRAADRQRIENDNRYNVLKKEFNELEKGVQQKELENLEEQYRQLENERLRLEIELENSKKLTMAWKQSPSLHYQAYLAGQGLGWGWLKRNVFNPVTRLVGGAARVVTGAVGVNICKAAETERDNDFRARDIAVNRYQELLGRSNALKDVQRKAKQYVETDLPKKREEIKALQAALAAQVEERRAIMVSYEAQKRAEELALAEEARKREEDAKKKAQEVMAAAKTRENSNTLYYLAAGGVVLYLLTRGKKTTNKVVIKGGKKVKV